MLQARAGQAIAVGNMFPQQQQAIATYSRVDLSRNIAPLHAISALPGNQFPFAFSNWLYGFNLSWELDLWGRIRRNIESNNAMLEASTEDFDDALVTLLADVATNYVNYRVAQQQAPAQPQPQVPPGTKLAANNLPQAGELGAQDQHPLVPALQMAYSSLNHIRNDIKDYLHASTEPRSVERGKPQSPTRCLDNPACFNGATLG